MEEDKEVLLPRGEEYIFGEEAILENDIKILEQFLVGNKYCEGCEEKCVDCYIEYEEVQAVANLLTRYKQLEEENESLVRQYEYQGALIVNEYMQIKNIKKLFIPKSKVKEKIEELKKQYEDYSSKWEKSGRNKAHPFYRYLVRIEAEIDILQELLEEE